MFSEKNYSEHHPYNFYHQGGRGVSGSRLQKEGLLSLLSALSLGNGDKQGNKQVLTILLINGVQQTTNC
jgi:hypothetical protein